MTNATLTADKLDLSGFTGSETFYASTLLRDRLVHTDGIRHVAEECGAYWLIDLVASYQGARLDRLADGFQIWRLRKLPDSAKNMAEATCWRNTPSADEKPIVRQLIPFTDFPFDRIDGDAFEFYACGRLADGRVTVLLKSEY